MQKDLVKIRQSYAEVGASLFLRRKVVIFVFGGRGHVR